MKFQVGNFYKKVGIFKILKYILIDTKPTQSSEMVFHLFVFRANVCTMRNEEYIDINKVAKVKGLKSTRSLRIAIQKGKYVAREVTVFGGKSYEILYSSLEPEIQEKLEDEEIRGASLVPSYFSCSSTDSATVKSSYQCSRKCWSNPN